MPNSRSIPRVDQALAGSVATGILVSNGSVAVPSFDANFSWDSVNRRHVLKGQAAGLGGDRLNIQNASGGDLWKLDASGTRHTYPANMGTTVLDQHHPQNTDPNYPVTFNFGLTSNSNDNLGAPPNSDDNVFSMGHNDNCGTALIPGYPVFRDAWESRWWNGTGWQMERHVGAVYNPATGTETRPFGFSVLWSDLLTTGVSSQASSFTMLDNATAGSRQWVNWLTSNAASNPTVEWSYLYPGTGRYCQKLESTSTTLTNTFGAAGADTVAAADGNNTTFQYRQGGTIYWNWNVFAGDPSLYLTDSGGRYAMGWNQGTSPDTRNTWLNSRLFVGNADHAAASGVFQVQSTAIGTPTSILQRLAGQTADLAKAWDENGLALGWRLNKNAYVIFGKTSAPDLTQLATSGELALSTDVAGSKVVFTVNVGGVLKTGTIPLS